MKMRMNLLCLVNRDVSQLTIDSPNQRQEAQLILQIMSFRYIETFHKLTTVPSMGELRSVPEQVHSIFMSSINTPTAELFPDTKTQEHSYYILGFLGHQSAKQAKRRAKSSAMSKLLASFASSHFIQQNHEAYSALLADESIPSGLVQRRVAFGGLKFATRKCWEVFAIIDFVYSRLATPENFILFGGTLSGDICNAVVHNRDMQKMFFGLLSNDYSSDDEEQRVEVFRYIMRVFCRVRGKDVSRKYNNSRFTGNQVTFRPSIGAQVGKKRKINNKKNSTTELEEDIDCREHNAILAELDELDADDDPENEVSRKITTSLDEDSDNESDNED